ncbi:MAG TPA: ATP-binding cassette domain-containing protein, partial [Candidatus Pacebacteria bacterium]|nr:ATP-binding cassette domain-containing protein [Candidatus Paceibacterota bacterium]
MNIKMKLITLENISKEYPDGFVALDCVNCAIDQGEFVSLVGSSGAGKSTLLKMIYAEEFPTDGVMYFGGRDVADIKRKVLPHFRRN